MQTSLILLILALAGCDPSKPSGEDSGAPSVDTSADTGATGDGLPVYDLSEEDAAYIWGEETLEFAGEHVGSLGDFDQDGFADVIVGSPYALDGAGAGAVYVAFGPPPIRDRRWEPVRILGESESDDIGRTSAVVDLDRDGYDELFLGGGDRIYRVSGPELSAFTLGEEHRFLTGLSFNLGLGSVARVEDADADGRDAMAVRQGRAVYLIQELVSSLDEATSSYAAADDRGSLSSFAPGGDINGDGIGDLVIGTGSDALAFYGPHAGEVALDDADARLLGEEGDELGREITGPSDYNGDGYADVTASDSSRETTCIFYGPLDGERLSSDADGLILGEKPDKVRKSAAAVGDLDGDGFGDAVLGYRDAEEWGTTWCYLLPGPFAGALELPAGIQIVRFEWPHGLCDSVAGAGDVDGSGSPDLLLGDKSMSFDGEGGAWLVAGEDLAPLLAE